MGQKRCFECWFVRALPTEVGEHQALCLETKGSKRYRVAYEDGACPYYEESPLVAYAFWKGYEEGQKAAGPTERQYELHQEMMEEEERDDDWGREGGER